MRGIFLRGFLVLASTLSAVSAYSQVGITAGGDGEQLEQKRLELTADVKGHFAQVKAAHIFRGSSRWRTELDIIYTLPDGAIPTDFAYYYRGERVPAFITEKERAKEIYKNITTRMQDPALIEFIGKKTFRVRIFPVEQGQDLRMEVGWIQIAKTINGTPTFDFPIKMRKKDPLTEISATVKVSEMSWLKQAMENIGLKPSIDAGSSTFKFDQSAVRPRKDWRFSLVPKQGTRPMTVFSGRSGSEKGYAAIAAAASNTSKLNSPMTMNVGGTVVTSGTYGPNSDFSQEVLPNHLGLKVWAYQRIRSLERSAKNREQVVEMSLRHNLISKFTSWIAIPTEERKRFAQMIKEAKTSVKAKKLASDVQKGKLDERAARAQYAELQKEILAVAADPDEFALKFLYPGLLGQINEAVYATQSYSVRSSDQKKKQYLRAEAKISTTFAKLSWLGYQPRSGYVASIYGYGEHLTNQILERKQSESEDWEFIEKRCPTLFKLSEAGAAEEAYWSATRSVFQDIRQGKYQMVDPKIFDRLAELKRKYKIKVDVDTITGLPYEDFDQKGRPLPPRTAEQLQVMANVAEKIGYSTRKEFTDISRYHDLVKEGGELSYQWTRNKKIDDEEIKEFKRKAAELSPRMAESCIRAAFNYVFNPWNNLVVLDETTYQSKSAYISAYQSKLAEYEKLLPELASQIRSYSAQMNDRFEWEDEQAQYDYIGKIGLVGSSQKDRDRAKEEYIKRLTWLYGDAEKARKEVDSLTLPIRERLLEAYRAGASVDKRKLQAIEKEFLKDRSNEYKGEHYGEDRLQRLKLSIEIAGLESTGAQTARVAALKKQLEPIVARMGDPLLSVTLPEDTRQVIAIFPWGETRKLTFNPKTGEYQARFDIPPTAIEGDARIVVLSYGFAGVPAMSYVPLTVDNKAPVVQVGSANRHLTIRDETGQVVRVKAIGVDGGSILLVKTGHGEWQSQDAVEDVSTVRVFAFDQAHNVSRYLGRKLVEEVPSDAMVQHPSSIPERELAGMNIQSVGHWRGIDFAGTLDEGLYYRRPGCEWTLLEGLPSKAARQFVPFGDTLAIRFGSGDLIALHEDFKFESMNSLLPRQSALAIASDGKTLAVAQTGGFSLLGEKCSHWFDLAELAGGAPSAISVAQGKVHIGMQGRGFYEIDLDSRNVDSFSEPQGLVDDWVTGFAGDIVGTFAGGAYRLADGRLSRLPELSGMQVTGVTPGGWIATRTGLFRRKDGSVLRIDLGKVSEIQSVAETGDSMLIATRDGVYRLRL